jgi:ribose 5-phosphate isomerase B
MHNDANVLALGGRTTGPEVAKEIVDAFITEPFMGAHHVNRIAKIGNLEKKAAEDKKN